MKIRAKHLISIILAIVVLTCVSITVSAVEPQYSDTNSVNVTLAFNGTTANCSATVIGAKGTTSITDGHFVLTDSKGNIVAEWTNLSVIGNFFTFSDSVSGLTKGETYTLTFSAKVNRNSTSEDVDNYVSKKC